MSYDPKSCGAQCDKCPLFGSVPVPPDVGHSAKICVVGEAPGVDEIREGRPFVGASGLELHRGLTAARILKRDVHLTNVLLCQPPKNELSNLLARISAENREKDKRNKAKKKAYEIAVKRDPTIPVPLYEEMVTSPIECCAPRLQAEVNQYSDFITLGGVATRAITGSTQSILSLRGGTIDLVAGRGLPARRVMPTVHPAFVLRAQRWTSVFRGDLFRANRWFTGTMAWTPPTVLYNPSPAWLDAFLNQPGIPYWTYDLETDGIEPLTANLRCVGIGAPDGRVTIVGILSRDGISKFYTERDELRVIEIMKAFFSNPKIVKVGHNSGSYDYTCLHAQWGIEVAPQIDTILLHRLTASELPHSLGFVGSVYTDAPSWKCYDPETEVLTPSGWVRFPDLRAGELVAQWSSGTVSFVQPTAYVDQVYTGEMWHITSNAADLLVTPDHKMVYKWRTAPDLHTCPVQELPKNASLPHMGTLSGGPCSVDLDYVRLLVAFQADGSWVTYANGSRRLDFGFTKQRKIERLTGILDQLGMPYSVKQTGTVNPRTRIWVDPHPRVAELWDHLGARKLFGAWLLSWPLEARIAFLDELLVWDGTDGVAHANYNSTQEENVDWVQACATVSGRAARKYGYRETSAKHAPIYRVVLPGTREGGRGSGSERGWSRLETAKVGTEQYTGRVYCVSVPAGFILVRRNGKVTVSGNTDREGNKIAFSAESDEQLHEYCAMDVRVTSMLLPPLFDSVKTRGQSGLIAADHRVQKICAEMHRVGMWVDQAKRLEYEKKYVKEAAFRLEELRRSSPIADFNPGSPHQIRRLLFDDWNLVAPLDEKERYTASGDPATSDDVLRSLLTLPHLSVPQREFIYGLRKYRKAQKLLGTYIVKLRPSTQSADLGWDDEAEPEDYDVADEEALNLRRRAERETREKYGMERTGIVNPRTGRMHPGYNAHVATCVTPDTWILTEDGLRQIGTLQGFGEPQTETSADGLRLHDGAHYADVSHLQNPGVCPTLRVETVLGVTLTATPHHQVHIAARPKFQWQDSRGGWHPTSPAWRWCRMDELEEGAYIEVPIGMDVWGSRTDLPQAEDRRQRTNATAVTLPRELSKELAFFMGVYNADGSLHDANGSFSIRLSGRPENVRHWGETRDACVSLFGEHTVRATDTEVAVTSVALSSWAEALELGRRIENKRCPSWLLSAPREFCIQYLRGLSRDSSTYISSKVTPVWRYTGTEQLCREVQMMLFNIGIVTALEDARTARQPHTWELLAQADEAKAVGALLGIEIPAPTRQGDTSQRRPKYIHRGKTLWLRVLSVMDAGPQQVYDVTIPSTHQFWANGTVSHNTGRLSSSKPINAQNFPKGLRAMVRAAPGHVLIGADADQLELRIAAALWGAKRYLAAFAASADPHSSTALACFGEAFRNAAGFPGGHWMGDLFIPNGEGKWTGEGKTFRDLAKRVQYASQYMATVETVHRVICQTETEGKGGKTELPYLSLALAEVRKMHQAWLDGCPEFPMGWEREIDEWRRQSFLMEPIDFRRRDFLDGENPNELVNFKIQSSGAALMNRAIIALADAVPCEKWGPGTGIINQCHDALVLEVPADGAEVITYKDETTGEEKQKWIVPEGSIPWRTMQVLNEAMNQEHPALPGVKITAAADIGLTWKEVG